MSHDVLCFAFVSDLPMTRLAESESHTVVSPLFLSFHFGCWGKGERGKEGFSGSGCITAVCQLNERGSSGALIVCFGLQN